MTNRGHLSSRYMAFLKLTHEIDPECQKNPDMFFPEDIPEPTLRINTTKAAKSICRACPMKDACFTYAIETNQRYGIWGATEPYER